MGTFNPAAPGEKPGTDLRKATSQRGSGGMFDVIEVVAKAARSSKDPLDVEWVEVAADVDLPASMRKKPLMQLGIPYSVQFFVPGYGNDWYQAFVSRNEGGTIFIDTEPSYGKPFLVKWLRERYGATHRQSVETPARGHSPGAAEMHHQTVEPGLVETAPMEFPAARLLAEDEIGSRSIDQLNGRK
jgi:hypothetical protein